MRGRDIKRYSYDFADLYIIATFPSKHYEIDDYPAVKNYLLSYGIERLEQTGKTYRVNNQPVKARKKTSNKWFETQDSISYWDDFSKQKIVWGEISDKPKFALDFYGELFAEATTFIMTGENLPFLLPFLNSKISEYYFSTLGTTTGVGTVRWKKYKLEQFHIPRPERIPLNILQTLDSSINQSEDTINSIIYKIYSLTDDEIQFVESFVNR